MKATYILDTSKMLTRELRIELEKIFVDGQSFCNLYITVIGRLGIQMMGFREDAVSCL